MILCSIIFSFYFPVKFTLGMGQINFLILFLFLLSIYLLEKKRHNFAGVFLGLSIMIKFFPVLFLPYLMILKKWRILFSFMLVCLSILLLTFIIVKPDINYYFYKNIVPTLFNGWKTDYYNQSLSGFLGRQMATGFLREALRGVISVVLIAVSFLIIWLKNSKKATTVNLAFGLLITLSLLINNFSWQHHFVWLLFPFITIFYFMKNKKFGWHYYLVLAISFFLVGFNLKSPNVLPVILISHVFYGALMLWGLNLYLLAKHV